MTTDFDTGLMGFDRRQVRRYVGAVEAEIALITADREACATQAEHLRRQVEELRSERVDLLERIDRICASPIEPSALRERTTRMLELVGRQAADTVARANAATEHCWSAARESAARLAEGYQRMAVELTDRDRALAAEQRRIIDGARREADRLVAEAHQRGRELDAADAARRREVLIDFELAVHHRRAEVHAEVVARREHGERTARALEEESRLVAGRVVAEAVRTGGQRLAEATARADRLHAEALDRARVTIDEARREADRVRAEAAEQAGRVVTEARDTAGEILRRARDEATVLLAEAERSRRCRREAADGAIRLAMLAADQRLAEVARQVDELAGVRVVIGERLRATRDALAEAIPVITQAVTPGTGRPPAVTATATASTSGTSPETASAPGAVAAETTAVGPTRPVLDRDRIPEPRTPKAPAVEPTSG